MLGGKMAANGRGAPSAYLRCCR